MKLENQVVSLEPSKKLKELGVKQESIFVWEKIDWEGAKAELKYRKEVSAHNGWIVSAFTVAELGEMLPEKYKKGWLTCQKVGLWEVGYEKSDHTIVSCEANTEADARAAMLIYLIENKLIT